MTRACKCAQDECSGANPGRLDPGPKARAVGLPNTSGDAIIAVFPSEHWRVDLFEEAGTMTRKLIAEFIGTFMLVTSVCGAALFSIPSAGLMTVAFAIGTAVLAMAYAVGSISGGHFNPAVTCGLAAAGRFSAAEVIPYIIAQVIGGIVAAAIFYFILSGAPTGKWNDFIAISNIYGGEGHFPLAQVALIEIVLTALFLIVIVSVTLPKAPIGFAPIAIGLTLTFIHLVAIPVDNASVNPARSTATAIFGGGAALGSLWVFWAAPIVGGVIGGLIARWLQTAPAGK
jgi:aquaporin Z